MKNALIISIGILALFLFTSHAHAQTLKATNFEFLYVRGVWNYVYSGWAIPSDILSVTMPSTKGHKWTVVLKDGTTYVTTYHVELAYRTKNQHYQTDEMDPE